MLTEGDFDTLNFERKIAFSVAELPPNCKDINDYYKNSGDLQELCDDALPGIEYLALSLVPEESFDTLSRGKQQALKKKIKSFFIECRRAGADNADIQTLCECLEKKGLPEKWLDDGLMTLSLNLKTEIQTSILAIVFKNNINYCSMRKPAFMFMIQRHSHGKKSMIQQQAVMFMTILVQWPPQEKLIVLLNL